MKQLRIAAVLAGMVGIGAGIAPAQSTRAGIGAIPYTGGVTFRVWAPNAQRVAVAGQFNSWNTNSNVLVKEADGQHWSLDVTGAAVNQQYKFVVRINGADVWKKDPRSRQVQDSGSNSNSIIADLNYTWTTPNFTMTSWDDLVVYQMHIGTFNDTAGGAPGTFLSAINRLDHVRDLGASAIALLPINEFAGDFSWGYNPAYLFSPEKAYGTPRQFKQFIDAAHARGLAVFMDVVHNHYGPTDLDIWEFDGALPGPGGIYFYNDARRDTQWGSTRPNFNTPQVRSFIRDSAFYWLEEFRCDGIRWDSVSNIYATENGGGTALPEGWSLMQEINAAVNGSSLHSGKIMISEDFHSGDDGTNSTGSGGMGFDSTWDGAFVHPMRDVMRAGTDAGRSMGNVAQAVLTRYSNRALARVIYTESHDEVGNEGKARVPSEVDPTDPDSYRARKLSTLGGVVLLTSPGIPMMFQGQELLEDGRWQDTDPIDWQKATTNAGVLRLYRDLIALRRNTTTATRGLRGGNVNLFHFNDGAKVVAYHRWMNGGAGDDTVVVANFSATRFNEYNIGLPASGTWYVVFNSDSTRYGTDYENFGPTQLNTIGGGQDDLPARGTVALAPYTALILSQRQPVTPTATTTPSPSPSPTPSPSPSPSRTATATASPSPSATASPSLSPSPTFVPTRSPNPTGTATVSPSPTATATDATATPSATPSLTPTATATPTVSATPIPASLEALLERLQALHFDSTGLDYNGDGVVDGADAPHLLLHRERGPAAR